MAIRMMCDPKKATGPVETVRDYPGHEAGRVSHGYRCPHGHDPEYSWDFGPGCGYNPLHESYGCSVFGPLYMETTYEGAVLDTGEINGYDDSDFYAVVYDAATDSIKRVEYASTRGWTYPNGAAVDATPEVVAKAEQVAARAHLARLETEEDAKVCSISKGDEVEVVKGRKVAKGTVGVIFWIGPSRYGNGMRVGLKDAAGETHWTAASNLKLTEAEVARHTEKRAPRATLEARAQELAKQHTWRAGTFAHPANVAFIS